MLLFLDSFDHYVTADITKKWTQYTSTGGTDNSAIGAFGRRSSNGLKISGTNGLANTGPSYPSKTLAPSGDTFISGFAFKCVTAFSATNSTVTFLLGIYQGGTIQIAFKLNSSGQIECYRSGNSTNLLGTSSTSLTQNTFHYLEFKVKIHGSTGTVDVYLDGISILALTSQNTQATASATWDSFDLGVLRVSSGATMTWHFDDLYVADGSGSGWNDVVGDTRVDAVFPTSNGTTRDWTPSTGTDDYAVVDEAAANGDTDYLTGTAADDMVTMGFPNAPVAGADIYGLQVVAQARKTDAGTSGHKAVTRIGSTDYEGDEVGLASTYSFKMQPWDLKPSDATPWSESDFNAAEFGAVKSV